jgi:UDP-N-acetylglucosamine acyltransferase
MAKIDSHAIVSPKAELAGDVEVGPFTIIEPDVIIDSGSRLASCALIASGTRIGKNCTIFHSTVIGTVPQDLKFEGEYTTVQIGDNTIIREFCTVNRGTKSTGQTIIGSNCLLMTYSHVAHDCHIGNNVILANSVNLAGHIIIEDYVAIGGVVPIHQFVRIGKHSFIGGGFRVDRDVPPYILAAGYPLKYMGLNVVGLRRRNFSSETIAAIKSTYRIIYQSNLNRSQALEQIKNSKLKTPEIDDIYYFISQSERGII